jgi:hypothetical protein
MGFIIGIVMLAWIINRLYPTIEVKVRKYIQRFRLARNINVFENQYIETKVFYANSFREMPSLTFMDDVDVTKAFAHITNQLKHLIVDIHQSCFYNRQEGVQQFTRTVFVLSNKMMIELGPSYAEILYTLNGEGFVDKLVKELSECKAPEKKEPYEINIITSGMHGLELKSLEINETILDIDLYYNDDFKEVEAIIRQRLMQENDKGIILLHGLPGTGKTTYLRHLIGGLKKKVLFVSPSVADNLMNPDFIDLLIDNPNAVLVIEDAENIIMDRKVNSSSSVSNLLNLSDGLLSDCLNVQIICTFNNALSMVDSALMRKGRLIAKYEFGKLAIHKAQKLSDHLGLNQVIKRPMTLAEVTNPEEMDYVSQVNVIGFRRETVLEN